MLRYVNAKQAAVILGCRPSTVHGLANRGLLTRHEIKPYHAQYRYDQDEVERLAEQRRKTKPETSPEE